MNFNLDWFVLAGLILSVEAGIKAIKNAAGADAKAAAIGQLAVIIVQGAEKLSGKALVNDPKFQALVADAISAVADAQGLKA